MTTTHAAAQAELTHAGREVTKEETDRWLKMGRGSKPNLANALLWYEINTRFPVKFNPAWPISPLAARLLKASNAIHLYKRILP